MSPYLQYLQTKWKSKEKKISRVPVSILTHYESFGIVPNLGGKVERVKSYSQLD